MNMKGCFVHIFGFVLFILGVIFAFRGNPVPGVIFVGISMLFFWKIPKNYPFESSNTQTTKTSNTSRQHEDVLYVGGIHLHSEELKQIGTKLKALKGLSLEKQCKREGIPLKKARLSVEKSDEPEVQAQYHLLNKKDYDYDHVYYMENGFILLFDIMFFNYIWNHKSGFYTTSRNLIFKEEHKYNLLNLVRNMNLEKFKQNMEAMNEKWDAPRIRNKRIRKERREKLLNIFSAIDKKNLVKATRVYIIENTFHKGWPDLVALKLSNQSKLTFFEVKTTDNLLTHQMFIFRLFRERANFDMRVLKLNFLD